MYNKTINGNEYDFDRCSFEQLREYAAASLEHFIDRVDESGPLGPLGTKLESTARVPPEYKLDVAAELIEYCLEEFPVQGKGFSASHLRLDPLRDLVERYRKAV